MIEGPMIDERAQAEIPASPRAPAEARRWVSDLGGDLDASSRETVMLLLSELVSNSIRHGELVPGDHVDITVTRRDRVVRVEVHDEGLGFNLASVYPSQASRERNPDHGYGLALVDAMAARWGVDTARPTTVWFEFEAASG
jgi:anti-sigma regulatory factor (Ser/Thr protein kinase)